MILKIIPSLIYLIVVVLSLVVIGKFFEPPLPAASIKVDELKNVQTEALKIVIDLSNLLNSLAVVLLGVIGGFLLKKDDYLKINSVLDLLTILLSLIFFICSIYFGYILNSKIVEMLSNNMFDLSIELIDAPRRWQLNAFIIAIALFGFIIVNNSIASVLLKRNEHRESKK